MATGTNSPEGETHLDRMAERILGFRVTGKVEGFRSVFRVLRGTAILSVAVVIWADLFATYVLGIEGGWKGIMVILSANASVWLLIFAALEYAERKDEEEG